AHLDAVDSERECLHDDPSQRGRITAARCTAADRGGACSGNRSLPPGAGRALSSLASPRLLVPRVASFVQSAVIVKMLASARFAAAAALALLILCVATPAAAQVAPDQRWRTLDTPHFRVTFSEGLELLGRRTAARAEWAY